MSKLGFISSAILQLLKKSADLGVDYQHVNNEQDEDNKVDELRHQKNESLACELNNFNKSNPKLLQLTMLSHVQNCRGRKDTSNNCGFWGILNSKKSAVFDLFYDAPTNRTPENFYVKYFTFDNPLKERERYSCNYCFFQKIFTLLLDEIPNAQIEVRIPSQASTSNAINLIGVRKKKNKSKLSYKADCFLSVSFKKEEEQEAQKYLITVINREVNLMPLSKHPFEHDAYIIRSNQNVTSTTFKSYEIQLIDLPKLYFIKSNNDLTSILYQFNESIDVASKLEFDKKAFLSNLIPEKIYRKRMPEVIESEEQASINTDLKIKSGEQTPNSNESKKEFPYAFWAKVLAAPTVIASAFLIFKYSPLFTKKPTSSRLNFKKAKGL